MSEPEPIPGSVELTAVATAPERYTRIAITKNTKGYSYETTVSLRWAEGEVDPQEELRVLLRQADHQARMEMARREHLDGAA
jgi:hypothetical protein